VRTTDRPMNGAGMLLASIRRHRSVPALASIVGFALLTALAAQIRIPVPGSPVPITLQTLAVLLVGFCLRPREAAAAIGLYLGAGLAGLPVFAAAAGGFTGGYLVGFLMAAPVVSGLSHGHRDQLGRLILAAGAGTAVIFLCGVTWLALVMGGLKPALAAGLFPFVPGAVVKMAVAVAAVRAGAAVRLDARGGWTPPGT
jgi:biotin transport system substrate-specific component